MPEVSTTTVVIASYVGASTIPDRLREAVKRLLAERSGFVVSDVHSAICELKPKYLMFFTSSWEPRWRVNNPLNITMISDGVAFIVQGPVVFVKIKRDTPTSHRIEDIPDVHEDGTLPGIRRFIAKRLAGGANPEIAELMHDPSTCLSCSSPDITAPLAIVGLAL